MKESSLDRLTAELEEALAGSAVAPTPAQSGRRLYDGTVAGNSGDDVIVELGPRVEGAVPKSEFDEVPATGASLRVSLRGREDGLWLFSVKEARALAEWNDMEVGSLVKGTVIGINKGGLELRMGSILAFMPASQVALHHVEDLASYAGQTLVSEVLEIDREKDRVVLSRRSVLEAEREQSRSTEMQRIEVGAVVRGKVKRIETFGAFVEVLPGIEGLLHVSNMSHQRVEDAKDFCKVGDDLEICILKIEEGGKRIGLGRKQLDADPWDDVQHRYSEDQVVPGKIVRLVDFGAFVQIEPGLEGLLHVSQLGAGRVRQAKDVLNNGEELAVRIVSIDPHSRRLSLSRLDSRGAIIGSEDAVDEAEISKIVERGSGGSIGTSLGALLGAALKKH